MTIARKFFLGLTVLALAAPVLAADLILPDPSTSATAPRNLEILQNFAIHDGQAGRSGAGALARGINFEAQ
jgi:hypothetical protein